MGIRPRGHGCHERSTVRGGVGWPGRCGQLRRIRPGCSRRTPGGRSPVHSRTPRPESRTGIDLTGRPALLPAAARPAARDTSGRRVGRHRRHRRHGSVVPAARLAVAVSVAAAAIVGVPRLRPDARRSVPRHRTLPTGSRAAPRIPPAPLHGPARIAGPIRVAGPARIAGPIRIAGQAGADGTAPSVVRAIGPGRILLGPVRPGGHVMLALAGVGPGQVLGPGRVGPAWRVGHPHLRRRSASFSDGPAVLIVAMRRRHRRSHRDRTVQSTHPTSTTDPQDTR